MNGDLTQEEVQFGTSKIFIRTPETYFRIERLRERRFDRFAELIQRAWRNYRSSRDLIKLQNVIAAIYAEQQKVRRRDSIYCPFSGDNLDAALGKNEAVVEAFRDSMYRIIDYYDENETVLFTDIRAGQLVKASSPSSRAGASLNVEPTVLVLTTGAVYLMDRITPDKWTERTKALKNGAALLQQLLAPPNVLFLRRRIALKTQCAAVNVSKFGDNCLQLQCHLTAGAATGIRDPHAEPATEHFADMKAASTCAVSGEAFSMFKWKHHCRVSGKVVAAASSHYLQTIPDMNYFSDVRVCNSYIGLASTDLMEDVVLVSSRRTEVRQ